MTKPDWLRERERQRKYRRCFTCSAGGDPCGRTNRLGDRGRLVMYRCRKFPSITFYEDTFACEHYEPR